MFDERGHRSETDACEKPAFFLNTFPKASPLNVCILLCIPVCDFRNNDRPRKEIHYRHRAAASRRKNGLAASRRNMILAFASLPSLTGRRGSRSHSRQTADPLHVLPGISAFFPPAPESASPIACLRIFREITRGSCWEFFCSGLKHQTDFPIVRVYLEA